MLKSYMLAGLLFLLSLCSTPMDATTFAQFQQVNPTLKAFRFNNTGSMHQFTASVPVLFTFSDSLFSGLDPELLGPQSALLMLRVTTSTQAVAEGAGSTRRLVQTMQTGYLSITRNSPYQGLTNLLTATFSDTLSGSRGGNTAILTSNTAAADSLVYTSDYIDLSNIIVRDFYFSLSGLSSSGSSSLGADYSGSGLRLARTSTGDYLRNFTAVGVGSFGASPEPTLFAPEPGSFALMGVGMVGIAGLARRFRR